MKNNKTNYVLSETILLLHKFVYMKKILHLSGAISWGGNEQQLVDAIFGLDKLSIENIIYCFKDSPLESYAKKNYLMFESVPKAKLFSYKYTKALSKYVKKHNINIIHLHTSDSVTAFVVADLLFHLKTPAVFSKKGISTKKKGLSIYKYNYKNIKKIVCVSNAVKKSFKTTLKPKNHHKLSIVYDGIKIERKENKSQVNLRDNYKIPKEKIVIGNIANHTRAKDLITFIKTVNELVNVENIKNVHFVQIGKQGKYSNNFIPLIKEYNLEEYITITGFMENAMDILSQFDIYMMTSEREGLPITIYEAFLKKTPVVSTKAGGIPEAITHNENGLLSEIKDYKHLAKNLKLLIFNSKLQNKFADKSYELLFAKFTTIQLAANTLKIYKDILNEK